MRKLLKKSLEILNSIFIPDDEAAQRMGKQYVIFLSPGLYKK
jgi:hypothetical protein